MHWIICYDVPSDPVRYRLSRCLEGYGDRIQDSVFHAILDADLVAEMLRNVQAIIDPAVDKVAVVPACGSCVERRTWIGPDRPAWSDEEIVWVV